MPIQIKRIENQVIPALKIIDEWITKKDAENFSKNIFEEFKTKVEATKNYNELTNVLSEINKKIYTSGKSPELINQTSQLINNFYKTIEEDRILKDKEIADKVYEKYKNISFENYGQNYQALQKELTDLKLHNDVINETLRKYTTGGQVVDIENKVKAQEIELEDKIKNLLNKENMFFIEGNFQSLPEKEKLYIQDKNIPLLLRIAKVNNLLGLLGKIGKTVNGNKITEFYSLDGNLNKVNTQIKGTYKIIQKDGSYGYMKNGVFSPLTQSELNTYLSYLEKGTGSQNAQAGSTLNKIDEIPNQINKNLNQLLKNIKANPNTFFKIFNPNNTYNNEFNIEIMRDLAREFNKYFRAQYTSDEESQKRNTTNVNKLDEFKKLFPKYGSGTYDLFKETADLIYYYDNPNKIINDKKPIIDIVSTVKGGKQGNVGYTYPN